MIKPVRKYFDGLLIVGGGITEPSTANNISNAGADILVIGNLLQSKDFENRLNALVKAVQM